MVIAIFRSRQRSESSDEYGPLADRMFDLARSMPGFLAFKTFRAEDGERVSLIEFESDADLAAWRDHPEHKQAQQAGRNRFYSEYRLQVCQPSRSVDFDGETRRAEGAPSE